MDYDEFIKQLKEATTYEQLEDAYNNFEHLSENDKEKVRNIHGDCLCMVKQSYDAMHKNGTLDDYLLKHNGHFF